jgi:putative phage-type endonuclease
MIPQQNTPEWLIWRRDHIGASEAAIILNLSPWKTPHKLWLEKQELREEQPVNDAMRKGVAYEEEARQAFEKETGLSFFPRVMIHPNHHWMIASLDGMTPDGDKIVEIKVPGKRTLEAAAEGIIEAHYMCQLQHQLAVTGLPFAYFWVWDHDTQMGLCLTAHRDESLIAKIIEEETKFWECLRTATPPPSALDEYIVIETDEWAEAAEAWKDASAKLKFAEQQEKKAREDLTKLTDESKARGFGVRLTKMTRQGSVDMDKVCKRFSITKADLDDFRKESFEYYKIVEE